MTSLWATGGWYGMWPRCWEVLMAVQVVASSSGNTYGGVGCGLVTGDWVVVELYESE